VICGSLNFISDDFDQAARYISAIFCLEISIAYFLRSLKETPGDLTKNDIANDLECPLKVISAVSLSVSQKYSIL